ncbi:MAG: methyltransferase domain-containing protein [Myxococcota bacterium]
MGALVLFAIATLPAELEAEDRYRQRPPSRDGTGKIYAGREISYVMGHRGAGWLERDSREKEERPSVLIKALEIEPDWNIADIGAGTGYFSFRMAAEAPRGRVFAVDIQPEMLERIRQRARVKKQTNVVAVRGSDKDPSLPANTLDLALIVDAYHEFAFPYEMMNRLRESMKPTGRLVLVEYRGEDPQVPIKALHKMTEKQAVAEMELVGFQHVKTLGVLPRQHILIFKPRSKSDNE